MHENDPYRVFDDRITEGFSQYRLRKHQNANGDESVQVMHKTRKHVFGRGYVDDGTAELSLTSRLTARQARAVRDLLTHWLEENGGFSETSGRDHDGN